MLFNLPTWSLLYSILKTVCVCEMFLTQCSFHSSYAYDSEFVSNQELFPTVLYGVSNSLQNILSHLLHGPIYVVKIGTEGGKENPLSGKKI